MNRADCPRNSRIVFPIPGSLLEGEASVKRLFSERQFSLQRLDQICSLLGLEISDLVRRLDQAQRIDALTAEQEQELVQVRAPVLPVVQAPVLPVVQAQVQMRPHCLHHQSRIQ